jgi:hypothetical protein
MGLFHALAPPFIIDAIHGFMSFEPRMLAPSIAPFANADVGSVAYFTSSAMINV